MSDTSFQDNLAILYMTFSIPSILGSLFIVQDVLKSKKRRGKVFHRLMLAMAVVDFVYGLYTMLGPLALPSADELDGFVVNSYARGNWTTYNALSFVGQMARIASILYNGTLTLYYLLAIYYGWRERQSQQHAEKWLHMVPLTIGLATATVALSLDMYKDTPFGCTVAIQDEQDESRKDYNLVIFFLLVWLVFAEMVVAMTMIYHHIRETERKANRWRMSSHDHPFSHPSLQPAVENSDSSTQSKEQQPQGASKLFVWSRQFSKSRLTNSNDQDKVRTTIEQSKLFAMQATLYGCAYLATFLLPSVHIVLYVWIPSVASPGIFVTLAYMNAFFSTMQGFWNACIYIRPRYKYMAQRRKQKASQKRSMNASVAPFSAAPSVQPQDDAAVDVEEESHNHASSSSSSSEKQTIPSRFRAIMAAVSSHSSEGPSIEEPDGEGDDDYDEASDEGTTSSDSQTTNIPSMASNQGNTDP